MAGIRRALHEFFERSSSKRDKPPPVEHVEADPVPPPAVAAAPEPEPEPEPTVDERGARAILASSPPPLPPERPTPARRIERTAPPREPEPEPEPAAPRREWNLWELQRAVRDAPGGERHEEWSALLIHLREFANADGDLPAEFDALVRESFGPVLDEPEPATAS